MKRWSNEVQEAVQSRAALVQFHALALLHQVRWIPGFAGSFVLGCIWNLKLLDYNLIKNVIMSLLMLIKLLF